MADVGTLAVIFSFVVLIVMLDHRHKERMRAMGPVGDKRWWRERKRRGRADPANDAPDADGEAVDYAALAARLEARVKTLEDILDSDSPGWRTGTDDK